MLLMLTRRAWLAGVGAIGSLDYGLVRTEAADRFVDSVGLCTHLDSAPYAQYFDTVLRMGAALGVRHVRDEMRPSNDRGRWRRLFAEAGIRAQLLVSPATNTVAEMLAFVRALGPGAVSAVEGQNEGDSAWFRAQAAAQPAWAEAVTRYQRAVFEALRGAGDTRRIPVVSPTVLDYRPADMRRLADAAPFCDVVGLHAYLQRQQEPETGDDYAGIRWYLREMRDRFKPGAPAMVTETGYATGGGGISAPAAACYLPRLLLHLFQSGIVRSFLYEFMDEGEAASDPEQNYGLLTAAAAPKPAYLALRRLLGALADPGPAFDPAPLALAVEHGPPDLRLLALRKRDGEAVVALWRAVRVWDAAARRDIAVPAVSARLRFGRDWQVAGLLLEGDRPWTEIAVRRRRAAVDVGAGVILLRLSV